PLAQHIRGGHQRHRRAEGRGDPLLPVAVRRGPLRAGAALRDGHRHHDGQPLRLSVRRAVRAADAGGHGGPARAGDGRQGLAGAGDAAGAGTSVKEGNPMKRVVRNNVPRSWNLADFLKSLGNISPKRIRMYPWPGTAVESDVTSLEVHQDRLCELVDGVLVEK